MRAFEAGQRVITTIDSTLEKAANQVGRVASSPRVQRFWTLPQVRVKPVDHSD
jgi:hypothetical protein